jgi:hypothetical protein
MASKETLNILIKQASRWSTAALQDDHPFIAVLHANYGVAYILALRQIASDAEVIGKTGIDPYILERKVVKVQEAAAMALSRECPELSEQLGPLAVLARESIGG